MTLQTSFGTRLLISKADLRSTGLDVCNVPVAAELADGQILFAVDRVALTANNITYAATGDAFGYWKFFPAPDAYGIVPMWGFAEVVASRAAGVKEGERFYGYWPLATHLVCNSADVTAAGFSDPSDHRQGLGPFYNRYQRTTTDPGYTAALENFQALFRPLFTTAFLIDGFLAQNDFFGGRQVVISSASAKTAFALAFLLAKNRKESIKVIGLTSPSNARFVQKLGSYDQVVAYDALSALDVTVPTVYVDFSGSGDIRKQIHASFGDALKHSATIGVTHWTSLASAPEPMPGPEPVLFFAPSVAEAQMKLLGPAGFANALGTAWLSFVPYGQQHLTVTEHHGMAAAQVRFADMVSGRTAPAAAIILRLQG